MVGVVYVGRWGALSVAPTCAPARWRVAAAGAGANGQLGHDSDQTERFPKLVVDFMGTPTTMIACGRRHTSAYQADAKRLYAFGLNASGQLGHGTHKGASVPVAVRALDGKTVLALYAGGDRSFAIVDGASIDAQSAGATLNAGRSTEAAKSADADAGADVDADDDTEVVRRQAPASSDGSVVLKRAAPDSPPLIAALGDGDALASTPLLDAPHGDRDRDGRASPFKVLAVQTAAEAAPSARMRVDASTPAAADAVHGAAPDTDTSRPASVAMSPTSLVVSDIVSTVDHGAATTTAIAGSGAPPEARSTAEGAVTVGSDHGPSADTTADADPDGGLAMLGMSLQAAAASSAAEAVALAAVPTADDGSADDDALNVEARLSAATEALTAAAVAETDAIAADAPYKPANTQTIAMLSYPYVRYLMEQALVRPGHVQHVLEAVFGSVACMNASFLAPNHRDCSTEVTLVLAQAQ